jgi:DNA polymerase/3'-5' exonuclease PolX
MAQAKTKITYQVARDLAERIAKELSPVCQRIEIAGSVRREKKLIGDIEIVCIARQQLDLFGDPNGSLLAPHLEFLATDGHIIKGDKWGEKYKKLHVPAMPELGIDLFITTPDEWGYTYTIRTGCAEFSHLLVTPRQQGGYLPGHLRVGGCRIWEGSKVLPTPEESEFFAALGLRWVEPDMREVGLFEKWILREGVAA